jgi:hypothetical protein
MDLGQVTRLHWKDHWSRERKELNPYLLCPQVYRYKRKEYVTTKYDCGRLEYVTLKHAFGGLRII